MRKEDCFIIMLLFPSVTDPDIERCWVVQVESMVWSTRGAIAAISIRGVRWGIGSGDLRKF
jgi:hypothetical protein